MQMSSIVMLPAWLVVLAVTGLITIIAIPLMVVVFPIMEKVTK